ncbi:MAG TPA: isoprenyl transferase [Planctomycetota bacterium]|nr:isoprenyl transferase [Planctomycetota bacterium]
MTTAVAGLKIPAHIAIIMDGNGRWAKEQGLQRILGHESGAETVREITRECSRLGVGRLTLYAFSAENWKRPLREVDFLMKLLEQYLVQERKEIMENNIRFTSIGRLDELPEEVRKQLQGTIDLSAKNTGMVLSLALAYGGRKEIVDAVRRLAQEVKEGKRLPEDIDEQAIAAYLYDPAAPDPDLLIRTGGDLRVSNFLLWQISYTELWVTPVRWPDFKKENLYEAIREFSKRDRRFGNINDQA